MTKKKIAINGFGRIGRLSYKALLNQHNNIEVVAINDLAPPATLAHLLKYDSNHGPFSGSISYGTNYLIVDGKKIHVYAEKNPAQLPWHQHKIDTVLESTGLFTDEMSASTHLQAGAQKVIISAPAKGTIPTIVLGVNEHTLTGHEKIISNASCTTNCLAPLVKILEENFGIEMGFMNTVHAYTADQLLQDGPHKDLRRARAAACSIIPTSTGAAKAIELVLPSLKGRLEGIAMRVPVSNGSVIDFTALLKKQVTKNNLNEAVKLAAATHLKGIVAYTEDPIVSADIIGNTHSCIFDASLTAIHGNLIKLIGWYDNENGYAHRIADLISLINR